MTIKSKLKTAIKFVTKPIIRISVITDEEKLFLKHAHKFLDESAIKPEHRNK